MNKCRAIDEIQNIILGTNIDKKEKNNLVERLEVLRENISSLEKENENLLQFIEKLGGCNG